MNSSFLFCPSVDFFQKKFSSVLTSHTKDCVVKAMVFPVVMYGCESWTVKKAELRRIDAFELWCWRRLLRVPWRARSSNLKEINPEYSLAGLMLKLQYYAAISFAIFLTDNYLYVRKIMCFFFKSYFRIVLDV